MSWGGIRHGQIAYCAAARVIFCRKCEVDSKKRQHLQCSLTSSVAGFGRTCVSSKNICVNGLSTNSEVGMCSLCQVKLYSEVVLVVSFYFCCFGFSFCFVEVCILLILKMLLPRDFAGEKGRKHALLHTESSFGCY